MDAYFCESIWLLNCSALRSVSITETSSLLWLRLTSHSSLLLQFVLPVRPPGISHQSFLVYLPNLPVWVTIAFWTLRLVARLSVILALVLGFCSSGYDFAIPSSRLHLAIQTLGVAIRFVGNYALCGLSPQTDGMPVIHKKGITSIDVVPFIIISILSCQYGLSDPTVSCISLKRWKKPPMPLHTEKPLRSVPTFLQVHVLLML